MEKDEKQKQRALKEEKMLPLAVAIIGVSTLALALLLITRDSNTREVDENADVENYDLGKDVPFIFRSNLHAKSAPEATQI